LAAAGGSAGGGAALACAGGFGSVVGALAATLSWGASGAGAAVSTEESNVLAGQVGTGS